MNTNILYCTIHGCDNTLPVQKGECACNTCFRMDHMNEPSIEITVSDPNDPQIGPALAADKIVHIKEPFDYPDDDPCFDCPLYGSFSADAAITCASCPHYEG